MLEKQRAIVKALMAKKVLVTKQLLTELQDPAKVDSYYTSYVETSIVNPIQNTVVVSQYIEEPKKWVMQDFVQLFNMRLRILGKLLQGRQELQNLTSISRITQNSGMSGVTSVIGLVSDVQITKKENIIITLEDISGGNIKIIITKKRPELYTLAKDIVLDEVIGVVGMAGENAIFANNILFPDVPIQTELKKSPIEEYAVVISDIHVGSALFLENEFNNLIKWLKGELGSLEQRAIAQKVKYIFAVGDIVDGVGIYPLQERELAVKDIYKQYEQAASLFAQIPKNKNIIMCPGNHDAVRIAEPQPLLPKDICAPLWNLPNVLMVTNPAIVRVCATLDFPGFDFLLYHGYSYDYYGNEVESIKNSGRHISDKTDLIMKFLLQRRHLAPTHTSTLYVPNPKKDPLVIETIPDFFLSGHVHRAAINNYHGVTIVVGSCFQAKTGFQEKVGHEPTPCHVPIINLQTRQIKILNFEKAEENLIEQVT